MKTDKQDRTTNHTLAKQFAVQWKTLVSFLIVVIVIAVSLSATAQAV